ncbi:hypothetical protein BC834DRAFT_118442 [Gloeopeniophorella convolvens]|nr:hypothetical protein BC834DRAFT_118442 [Gloeopeniophorella convolvens]
MVSGSSTPTPLFVTPKLSAPRDIRLDQGSPSPEYPPQGPSQDTNFLSTNKSDTLLTDLGQAPAISRRGPAFRNRSQGSAQGLSTRSGLERGNVSASDFQFPEYPPPDSDPSMSSHSGLRAHSRTSPTRAIPPVLGRSRSATPADEPPHELYVGPPTGGPKSQRRPSLHRLASLAVMETTPIAPPVKPFAKASRDRSGGSAGGIGDLSSLPGLKDVLKVPTLEHQLGMTDLLPPSPTTLTTNLKPFTAAPSHLNFSFVPLDGTHPQSANASLAPSTSFGRANGISHLIPSPDLHPGLPSSASSSLFPAVHRRNGSFPSTSPTSLPPVRKLDFAALMASHEDTHAELGRIVDDLMQWLSITELGLTQLLERSSEDRIEEEAEDPDHGPSYEGTTGTDDESDALALAAR